MVWQLPALEAARKIRDGEISSHELVSSCLERIDETEGEIGAWAFLDPELALAEAKAMDFIRASGRPTGPLHGVPVAVKDIFDTANMPTAWGTEVHKYRQPDRNSAVVDKLHEAGAVVLGKTVTTELAFAMAGPTRNPHNSKHTAGASSAGSAASVAAGHAPLSIGSQTNGSTIRPAAFCGVYGFKPSRGIISRRGCLETSRTLDQVGVMGRSLEDVALLADVLGGFDPADPGTYARPKPKMLEGAKAQVPVEPSLAWFDLPYGDRLTEATVAGLEEVMDALGQRVERLETPRSFADVIRHQKVIHEYEFYQRLKDDPAAEPDRIHETLKPVMERGQKTSDADYKLALAMVAGSEKYFSAFFMDYDAILAPSALGEAPLIEDGAGDPICSTIWTFAGLPCLTLPLLTGETGLPSGVQLIGSIEEDDRLLRTAKWLEKHLLTNDDNSKDVAGSASAEG